MKFKCRAWSISGKKMLPWDVIKDWGIRLFYDPNYIVMLWTGLKDEEDTEIYRDDIMNPETHLGPEYGNQVVIWDNETAGFSPGTELQWSECVKVVGNIHENPELVGTI